ncbi:EAL domain-containing protein [Pantoea agglomerans]|uniref:EAL domain-containing protein n=1 Tax=Enterobacter agglomerans TaxID=549 RepID=UPI00320A535A
MNRFWRCWFRTRPRSSRRTGTTFVIDHYGRTLGAISMLQHGFVSGFKIDKSLTYELVNRMRIRMMFRAVATLGKCFGLSVAAKGVEDAAQRDFVTATRCDIMQGNGLWPAAASRMQPA